MQVSDPQSQSNAIPTAALTAISAACVPMHTAAAPITPTMPAPSGLSSGWLSRLCLMISTTRFAVVISAALSGVVSPSMHCQLSQTFNQVAMARARDGGVYLQRWPTWGASNLEPTSTTFCTSGCMQSCRVGRSRGGVESGVGSRV